MGDLHDGMEDLGQNSLTLIIIMHHRIILHCAVAGRGGLARIQDEVLAVPKGRRESEQRVY
jgi:hypothetical protein